MPLTTTRALQDLRPLILGDHALELNQQLILGARTLGRLHKQRFHPLTRELLDQQDLVGVFAAQSIRRIDERRLNLTLCHEIPNPLKTRALEARAAIAFVFEDPFPRDFESVALGELDQRHSLARNRVFLALLLRGDSRVDRRHLHERPPCSRARPGHAPARAPRSHRPAQASDRASDQTCNRDVRETRNVWDVPQPCLRRALRSALSARVTISPRVSPLFDAYERNRRTVLGGNFSVMGIEASSTGTG